MNIKEIDKKIRKRGINYEVSEAELMEFVKEYKEIQKLKREYKNLNVNRKETGREILERVNNLNSLMRLFSDRLGRDNNAYIYNDYISDCDKILHLLLELVNDNEYTIKNYKVRQNSNFINKVSVIGKKNILEKLDDNELCNSTCFSQFTTNMINKGNSLVMVTDHYNYDKVLPNGSFVKALKYEFKVSENIGGLHCYTYTDKLGIAVENLNNYIKIYGGDIDNISIDTLIERINLLKEEKQKVLRK